VSVLFRQELGNLVEDGASVVLARRDEIRAMGTMEDSGCEGLAEGDNVLVVGK